MVVRVVQEGIPEAIKSGSQSPGERQKATRGPQKTLKSMPVATTMLLTFLTDTIIISFMASVNTQFSIAVHVLAAISNYESIFTSEVLAGSVNANPVFVKRILVKLSKAKLVKTTVGKSGGYDLARSPKSISLFDIYSAVNPPGAFAIHTYAESKGCVVSCNIKEVMGEVLIGTNKAVENHLKRTTLADVVSKIRGSSR